MRRIAQGRRGRGSKSKIRRHLRLLAPFTEYSKLFFGPPSRYFVPSKIQNGNDNQDYNYDCHDLTMKIGLQMSSFADLKTVGCDDHHIKTDHAGNRVALRVAGEAMKASPR